jgi:hypothetical protein
VTKLRSDPAVSRHLRRRHGGGQPAGPTSTCRCAAPARTVRHALRDQERQFDPLHGPGDRSTRRSRQIEILEDGGKHRPGDAVCSTLVKGETRSMRSKEEAHDYRYFPDPDLLPLELDAGLRSSGSEGRACRSCRTKRRRRFRQATSVCRLYDAEVLVSERESASAAYEAVVAALADSKRDGKLGRELGDQRAVRALEQGRQGY